jgi:hypothetical protein
MLLPKDFCGDIWALRETAINSVHTLSRIICLARQSPSQDSNLEFIEYESGMRAVSSHLNVSLPNLLKYAIGVIELKNRNEEFNVAPWRPIGL